jgi:uncharacterized membrane protein
MKFLKTTLFGGVIFMIPVTIIIVVLIKAHGIMVTVAKPFANYLPVDSIKGVATVNIIAVVAAIFICFIAGIIAKSFLVTKVVKMIEAKILHFIPGYSIFKGMAGDLTGVKDGNQLIPVLAKFDDYTQIAFQIEVLKNDKVAIFVPGSPNPWTGNLMIMDASRIEPIAQTVPNTMRILKAMGQGTSELFAQPKA